jgi:hypothetical protein
MSQQPTATQEKDLVPPEERFWKRYSPHHEFPLSSVGSVVLHILSIGALVVIAYLITRTHGEGQAKPPIISVVALGDGKPNNAGGRSEPDGRTDTPGGTSATEKGDIENKDDLPRASPIDAPLKQGDILKPVDLERLAKRVTESGTRKSDDTYAQVMADLKRVVDQAGKQLAKDMAPVAIGKAGPRKDGQGRGKDKGIGDTQGPGPQGGPQATLQQRRQARWKMSFSTTGGADYLRQLHKLGAYLGVPKITRDNQIEYLVTRNPEKPQLKHENVSKLNRIFWFDHEPRSVLGMAKALGISTPPFFVAFFPETLEDRLRKLEQQAYSGDEDRIIATHFRVVNRGGAYEVELDPFNPIELKR